ncbi:MAG: helix-turn-helix domain-containing protein [Deltaproteobacteria bacterium]|nr:helix-turn-helix domain-containing protein [Deltaproteobacteria bacterium]
MRKITILAIHKTIATTVMGPMDIFFQAGQLWNHIRGIPMTPYFDVEIVSTGGRPVKCLNNAVILPHRAMTEVEQTDLIIIPSITDIEKTIQWGGDALSWLKYHYSRGTSIASICTGAFFLAETGLLNGKTATTHWGYVDLFRQMYPQVQLKPDRLITDEGTLFCAGALGAGMDLSIYLVEKYCGHEVATHCSKALIYDMGRSSQAPYSVFQFQKNHLDQAIGNSQKWIEKNYDREIDMNAVAKIHGMSRRTFERRFKKATGDTPLLYLQRTRIEAAKRKLESNINTFDEISYQVGYENSSHFRELFKKHTGLLPTEYQKKFRL